MSEALGRDLRKSLAFIEYAENKINTAMLKSRHGPVEINNALHHLAQAKILIDQAAIAEFEAGDTYE